MTTFDAHSSSLRFTLILFSHLLQDHLRSFSLQIFDQNISPLSHTPAISIQQIFLKLPTLIIFRNGNGKTVPVRIMKAQFLNNSMAPCILQTWY